MLPTRRDEDLVVREMPDETLVYDKKRNKAHCLNQTAALVWRHCDGETSVGEMAKVLHEELKIPPDKDVVRLALDRLGRANLLNERIAPSKTDYSRRELVRRLGVAAALGLPLILTITSPAAAQATTAACAGLACDGTLTSACEVSPTCRCAGANLTGPCVVQ